MLISPLGFNNFLKINNNKKRNSYIKNEIKNDVFIKSNTISFGSSLKEKRQVEVDFLTNSLLKKTQKQNLTFLDVSNCINNAGHKVAIKPVDKRTDGVVGKYYGRFDMIYNYDEQKQRFVILDNRKTLYLNPDFQTQEAGNENMLINTAHEYTHFLQSYDSDLNSLNFFNDYIASHSDDIDSAVEQVCASIQVANLIEEGVACEFIKKLSQVEGLSYTRLQNNALDMLGWLSKKNKIEDLDGYLKGKIDAVISKFEQDTNIELDKDLVLKFAKTHFEKEIEAYGSENRAWKRIISVNSNGAMKPFDSPRALTRIQLYEKTVGVIDKMLMSK